MKSVAWFPGSLICLALVLGCQKEADESAADSESAQTSVDSKPATRVAKDSTSEPILPATNPPADEEPLTAVAATQDDEEPAEEAKEEPKTPLDRLKEILNREPRSPKEFTDNVTEAVRTCEEILADDSSSASDKNTAQGAIIDLLAQGIAFEVEGFDAKLRAIRDQLQKADPPSPFLPKVCYHLLRIDGMGDDGQLKPTIIDAAKKFMDDFPDEKNMAVRLLVDIGQSADAGNDSKLAITAFNLLKEKFPDHRVIEHIEGTLRRLEAVGKPFPFEGRLLSGETISADEYKGKVVIVDFWATWCGPCLQALPELRELYEELHPKGLEVIGVSLDEEKEELETFLDEEKIPWVQMYPGEDEGRGWDHPIANKYGIGAIPSIFLVDREGKLVSTNLHGKELEEKVRQLIGGDESAETK